MGLLVEGLAQQWLLMQSNVRLKVSHSKSPFVIRPVNRG